MPNQQNYKILVRNDPNSRFHLIVDYVDFEVRLYWQRLELFSVRKIETSSEPFKLEPRRKYLLRYNNNDAGGGGIACRIIQSFPDTGEDEVFKIDIRAISGPKVIEFPFILWPSDAS
ncbi:MAG: hypothetical protein ACE5IW_13055 [bacterium]